ncbi:MAG: pilus assembly protein PilM [Candidatus Omnitrophica bacterium]|nr:pilus assembly protein PilM [Candidatus Omnitrophota bacterium]
MPKPLPDLGKVFDRLFARRLDRPLVAGHALFQQQAADGAAAASPAAGGSATVPSKWATAQWLPRLVAVVKALRPKQGTAVVGMDFGASAIKLVRVERASGEPQVVGVACEEYPPHAEGKAQEEFLQDRLKEFKRQGFLDGQLVLGLGNPQVAIELVTLPKMPGADLGRAIVWEAKERLGADAGSHSIRHLVVGETTVDGQTQQEILIIAAPRGDIIPQWRAFSAQGYRVTAVEPGILASIAACEAAGVWRPQEFIGILEIGRRNSTLSFLLQGAARFVRSFPIAGDSITQSIVDYCQTDYDTAETQKREIGLSQMALEEDRRVSGHEADPRVRVSHALGLYLERLAAELDHSLRYFTYELGQAKDRRLDCLYLVGGGALLKNLAAFLSSRLSARVEVVDPFQRCAMTDQARQQLQVRTHGTRLASALGLALRPVTK